MKRFFVTLIMLIMLLCAGSPGTSIAAVCKPQPGDIDVTIITSLDFGELTVPRDADGRVTISPDGDRVGEPGVDPIPGRMNWSAAEVLITGTPGCDVDIAAFAVAGDAFDIRVSSPTRITLDGSGRATVRLGASLPVPVDGAGTVTGAINFMATYPIPQ